MQASVEAIAERQALQVIGKPLLLGSFAERQTLQAA